MKYYAIIDGEQKGPFELSELPDAGVRPSTYVWCKEMADWEKAEDVADICRMFRNRLYDIMHPTLPVETPPSPPTSQEYSSHYPTRFEILSKGEAKIPTLEEIDSLKDYSSRPSVPLAASIIAVLAFPPTGIAALCYCLKTKKQWKLAEKTEFPSNEGRAKVQREIHELARKGKMMTWMSFFLGIFLYSCIFTN